MQKFLFAPKSNTLGTAPRVPGSDGGIPPRKELQLSEEIKSFSNR